MSGQVEEDFREKIAKYSGKSDDGYQPFIHDILQKRKG